MPLVSFVFGFSGEKIRMPLRMKNEGKKMLRYLIFNTQKHMPMQQTEMCTHEHARIPAIAHVKLTYIPRTIDNTTTGLRNGQLINQKRLIRDC